jgi:hypothetical protein
MVNPSNLLEILRGEGKEWVKKFLLDG